jgi:hypothetical protein
MSWASSWTSGLRTIGRLGDPPRCRGSVSPVERRCHGTGWVWVKLPEPVRVDVAEAMTVGLDCCPGCADCAGRRA